MQPSKERAGDSKREAGEADAAAERQSYYLALKLAAEEQAPLATAIRADPDPRDSFYDTTPLEKFLEAEHGKITIDGMRQALRDTAKPFYLNVQSMIFVPKRRELWVSSRRKMPVSRGPFVAFDEKTLFGAPAATSKKATAAPNGAPESLSKPAGQSRLINCPGAQS